LAGERIKGCGCEDPCAFSPVTVQVGSSGHDTPPDPWCVEEVPGNGSVPASVCLPAGNERPGNSGIRE